MAWFKANTLGKPVIMGRKTWESLPKRPLSGRTNIVLSRDLSFEVIGGLVCENFSEAVQIAREQAEDDGIDEVCVIGGSALFEAALPRARRLYLTEVLADVEGDVTFPAFDEAQWTEVRREEHPAGPDDEYPFALRVLERR
jgi:dihydrofolate reductase